MRNTQSFYITNDGAVICNPDGYETEEQAIHDALTNHGISDDDFEVESGPFIENDGYSGDILVLWRDAAWVDKDDVFVYFDDEKYVYSGSSKVEYVLASCIQGNLVEHVRYPHLMHPGLWSAAKELIKSKGGVFVEPMFETLVQLYEFESWVTSEE